MLARAKALHVAKRKPGRLVLGADQTLALGERRFSKPANLVAAAEQLRTLSGKTHTLYSAIALARDGEILFAHVAPAHMSVRSLSEDFIAAYLDAVGEKVKTSVGAYQVEGAGFNSSKRSTAIIRPFWACRFAAARRLAPAECFDRVT